MNSLYITTVISVIDDSQELLASLRALQLGTFTEKLSVVNHGYDIGRIKRALRNHSH